MHKSAGVHWRGQPLAAVLFDLDGTLLDTVADIALALNRTMLEYGCHPLAESQVRGMIGRGSPILIERAAAAQGRRLDAAAQAAMLARFFHHYGELEELNEDRARPYPGAAESLHAPHLIDVEVAQVLRRYVREKLITAQRGQEALEDLADLHLNRYPHDFLLPRMWELRSTLTAYDAVYVALAELLDATLLTCDRAIASAPNHTATVELI